MNLLSSKKEEDKDILIETPPTLSVPGDDFAGKSAVEIVKEYIPDSRFRIKLDDLVTREIKKILSETSGDQFPPQTAEVTTDSFIDRLNAYETIIKEMQAIVVLLAQWGIAEHLPVLRKIMSRLSDTKEMSGGKVVWLSLRYYPSWLLLYSGGIAAIVLGKYLIIDLPF